MTVREIAEFTVSEEFASMMFADDEGERRGTLFRKVKIDTKDPRFEQVGRLQRELRATKGKPFFYGWDVTRHPNRQEFEQAGASLPPSPDPWVRLLVTFIQALARALGD